MDESTMSDVEHAVYDAMLLLLNDRDKLQITSEQFLTVCKAAPDFALKMIDQNELSLKQITGNCRAEISQMVRMVEWELRGASEYIKRHEGMYEDAQFILHRLSVCPQEFSRTDLHTLFRQFPRGDHPVRRAALDALTQYVVSFAERIAAEPPGLSGDMDSLKASIEDYGFSPDLSAILQKIDDDLQHPGDAFDQVATMRHIRSFFERLHESVGKELQARKPKVGNGTPLGKCGQAIDYLERKNVTTKKIGELGRCLYDILSDNDYGVHALRASRDYTRLCRNMVVEYAVALFFELERRLAQPGDN